MSIMTVTYKVFPSGTVVQNQGSYNVTSNSENQMSTLNSFSQLVNGKTCTYSFIFWDANGAIITDPTVNVVAPSSDFAVDAWYLESCGNGNGGSGVATWAFSQDQHEVISDTPIGSVNVSDAWTGPPSTTVKTDMSSSPVQITALGEIAGYGSFTLWFQLGGGTVDRNVLTVQANGSCEAIAFFFNKPDPCQELKISLWQLVAIVNRNPLSSVWRAEYQKVLTALWACEKANGQPLTPSPLR
jgi:hypothetical protein